MLHCWQVSSGDRDQRTKEALGTMGASVFRFIFFTFLFLYSDYIFGIFIKENKYIQAFKPSHKTNIFLCVFACAVE